MWLLRHEPGNDGHVHDLGNTYNACLGDSIRITTVPSGNTGAVIGNNSFFVSGGFDINNSSGTNTAAIRLISNLTYLPTSGHLNGFGDWPELNALTDGSDPRTSSTNLALISTSAGAGAGIPGQWENLTAGLGGFPDVGAWQRAVSGGGSDIPREATTPCNMV